MKTTIKPFNVILLVLLSWNGTLFTQSNMDSLRIVREALQMIEFSEPEFHQPYIPNLSPSDIADMGFEQPHQSEAIKFQMRDGIQIHGQKYERTSSKTVLLLHGTLADSYTYNKMAGLLRESLNAEVIAIDLRGHGQSGGRPGDVSTLNQYAEDVDDIIASIRMENPEEMVILAGHSMGGGIVLRHVETFPDTQVDGYLLFAPNLGTSSPTTHQNLDVESNFIKIHLARGLGLRLLNEFGIHEYDSLQVVFYNLPANMPIRSYSYRSMQASHPKNYREALRAIDKPMLVLVGSADEAFIAEEYGPVIRSYSGGECYIVEAATHNGIRHSEEAMQKVRDWAATNNLE
ncbi:MAG: alpha/beta fold hydrolase [Bacteroidota bacterium]